MAMLLYSAGRADSVVDMLGVNVHGTGAYASWVPVAGAFDHLGIRHARTGRVNLGQQGQRDLGAMFAREGITAVAIPDDFGNPTPATRMAEVANTWGGVAVDAWEGPNEPNNGVANPAAWPDTIATNGPTSTDTTLGKNEVRRQLSLIADSATGGTPTTGSPLSIRGLAGWYAALGDLTATVDLGSAHIYPTGWYPEHAQQLTTQRADARACYAGLPVWITEYGWHDLMTTTSTTHHPTSPAAAATYAARLPFEAALAGFARVYIYELVDETTATDLSAHFGLFDPTWAPKPVANAIHNLTGLYTDDAGSFTPPEIALDLAADPGVAWAIHATSDGRHLIALWQPQAGVWDPVALAPTTPPVLAAHIGFGEPVEALALHTPANGARQDLPVPSGAQPVDIAVGGDLVVLETTSQWWQAGPRQFAVEASYHKGF